MHHPIRYTGHPFIDVGIGATLAIVGKKQPQDLTPDDLHNVAGQLIVLYTERPSVQNFIVTMFPNATFVQPKALPEVKQDYGRRMLFAFASDELAQAGDETCTYFPYLKPFMRAKRQHVPLLTSEDTTNFSARGVAGLPVSGLAIFFIHAMPLGCVKCGGRYIAFHQLSHANEERSGMATWRMARRAWEHNRNYLDFDGKIPAIGSHPRTRYVEALLRARSELNSIRNVTGYYFTNYGTGAEMTVLQLSNAVVDFIDDAQQDHTKAWGQLVNDNWQREKVKADEDTPADPQAQWRNTLFESLFNAEEKPQTFLKMLMSGIEKGALSAERFALVRLFMRKVMNMQDKEIELYVSIGHRLAEYVDKFDYNPARKSLSWKFYHSFKDAKRDQVLKLIRSARERVSKSGDTTLLIPLQEFVVAFVRTQRAYGQFELARDIVAYALFDRLHELGHTMHGSNVVGDDDDEVSKEYDAILSTMNGEE
jgi:CRISPR-associated protein Cst1